MVYTADSIFLSMRLGHATEDIRACLDVAVLMTAISAIVTTAYASGLNLAQQIAAAYGGALRATR